MFTALTITRPGAASRATSSTSASVVSMTSGASTVWLSFFTTCAIRFASSRRSVIATQTVSYTHLRAHETRHEIVCRLLLEKKKKKKQKRKQEAQQKEKERKQRIKEERK